MNGEASDKGDPCNGDIFCAVVGDLLVGLFAFLLGEPNLDFFGGEIPRLNLSCSLSNLKSDIFCGETMGEFLMFTVASGGRLVGVGGFSLSESFCFGAGEKLSKVERVSKNSSSSMAICSE